MRGLIAAVVIIVVVAGVVLMGNSGSNTATNPNTGSQPANNNGGERPKTVMATKIVIECEDMKLADQTEPPAAKPGGSVLIKQGDTVCWQKVTQSEGVSITYIDIPDGWIHTCGMDKIKDQAGKLPGLASYEFEAPRDDTYYINLRAKWMDTCGNSVWVKIDDGEYYCIEDQNGEITKTSYKWAWHQLLVAGMPKAFKLSKGKHTIWMNTREDGVKLDQWVLSSEATPQVGEAAKKAN